MLGEIDFSDNSFTGESGTLQNLRDKAREFQVTLNNLDILDRSLGDMLYELNGQGEALRQVDALREELNAKKSTIKAAAEAINLASNAANAVGIRFPVLSVPFTLGNPLVVAGVVAAMGLAAAVIYFATDFIPRAFSTMDYIISITAADSESRKNLIAIRQASNHQIEMNNTSLGSKISNLAKYAMIAFGLYLAYNAYKGKKYGNN
jgi:hypothetical protein